MFETEFKERLYTINQSMFDTLYQYDFLLVL